MNSTARPPIHWLSRKGCDRSQWDSVLGQGSAWGYGRLFKSFFWLSCPFSKRNARCKAPADALNVVTDYSWLTNRRAGSGPINPPRFTPMPLQGDSGAALTVGGVNCVGQQTLWLKSRGKMIWQLGLSLLSDWSLFNPLKAIKKIACGIVWQHAAQVMHFSLSDLTPPLPPPPNPIMWPTVREA